MTRTALAAIALLVATAAHGAGSAIDIGGEQLTIGMSETPLLDNLKKYYRVVCGEDVVKSCLLTTMDGPEYRAIANVVFTNGKLTNVRKYWADDYKGSDPVAFVQSLHDVLTEMKNSGPGFAVVSVDEIREPGVTRQFIQVTQGNKRIVIQVAEGIEIKGEKVPTFVNLDEVIE